MFCPICREEYREGFTWCSECHASLVDELSAEETQEGDNPVSIFEGDSGSAAGIRAMLEGAGIEAWIKNEEEHGVLPNLGPVEVLVCKENKKDALEAINMPKHDTDTNYDDSHSSSGSFQSDPDSHERDVLSDEQKNNTYPSRAQHNAYEKGHQGKGHRHQGRRI